MAENLFSVGAQLTSGAANTTMDNLKLEENRRQANLATLQSTVGNIADLLRQKMADQGAMQRQELQGRQAMDLERQKQTGDFIQVPDNIWDGLGQTSGADFSEFKGQPVHKDVFGKTIAAVIADMKIKSKPTKFKEGGKEYWKVWDEDKKDYVTYEAPRPVGEMGFKPPAGGEDKETAKKQKSLATINSAIQNDNKALDSLISGKGEIPEGNAFLRAITFGKAGNLSATDRAKVAKFQASVNRLRQNLTREQELITELKEPTIDRSDVLANLEAIEKMMPGGDGTQAAGGNPDDLITIIDGEGAEHQILRKNFEIAKKRDPKVRIK